jgi:hypothetical protein
MKQVDCLVV